MAEIEERRIAFSLHYRNMMAFQKLAYLEDTFERVIEEEIKTWDEKKLEEEIKTLSRYRTSSIQEIDERH